MKQSPICAPDDRFDRAFRLQLAGQAEAAVIHYEQLLASEPRHGPALHSLAVIAYERKDYPRALGLLQRAVIATPKEAVIYNTLALTLQACGMYNAAMDSLIDAVTLNPEFVGAWRNLSQLQSALGRQEDAARALQKAIELETRAVNTYNEAGLLLVSQQRLQKAIEAFRAGIACNPRAFTLYHNLGNILMVLGQVDEGILCIVEALKWAPRAAQIYVSLGNALRVKGDLNGAQTAYDKAVELDPSVARDWIRGNPSSDGKSLSALNPQFESRIDDALRLYHCGQAQKAASICTEILSSQPDNCAALNLLGVVSREAGDAATAVALLSRAVQIDSSSAQYRNNLGEAFQALGQPRRAVQCYIDAVCCRPTYAEAYRSLARLLMQLQLRHAAEVANQLHQIVTTGCGTDVAPTVRPRMLKGFFAEIGHELHGSDPELALLCFRAALRWKPDSADMLYACAVMLDRLGRFQDALAAATQAVQINPLFSEAHFQLGIAFSHLGRFDESVGCHRKSIELCGDEKRLADLWCRLGSALASNGQLKDAVEACRKSLALSPDNVDTHMTLSGALLKSGDLSEGWKEYEWRLKRHPTLAKGPNSAARWRGEALSGRTILIQCEQGFGDTIQFCRYVPLLGALGARVILEAPKPLAALLSALPGVSKLIASGDELPSCDYYCRLLSLPLEFQTTLNTIVAPERYLAAPSEKVLLWKNRLGAKKNLRVGLVWAGGHRPNQPELWSIDTRRNIPLQAFAKLPRSGIEYYCLQKGDRAEAELAELSSRGNFELHLHAFSDEIRDFADTAGLIENLDLVISADTSTAHLAGALGKPVWILNRYDSCWRWLTERSDSPWYPTAKLFRQAVSGDWEAVIHSVADELNCVLNAQGRS